VHRYHGIRILEWTAQSLSDYCDSFGDPMMADNLWKIIRQRGCDVIRLKNVGPEALANCFLKELRLVTNPDDCCMQVESRWPDGDAWFRTLNKKKRGNHTRGLKLLGELGRVQVEHHSTVPAGLIERLVALKLAWLRANELSSPLVENGPILLTSLAKALAEIGKLCIVLIRCDDEVVAASINAVETDHLLAFFAAYDPKYDRCSPGIVLMNEYTKWAFSNGFTIVDYLRGAETYKLEFTTKQVGLSSFVGAQSLRGEIVLALYQIYNRWKKTNNPQVKTMDFGGAYSTKAGTSRMGQTAPV
jgi:CelD/BcsL family acetyltransferase involved in cellulose biosynthesis